MQGCEKCRGLCGILILLLGIAFLLVDLGMWSFWNVSWYTAIFLVIGLGSLASKSCPNCQAESTGKKKK